MIRRIVRGRWLVWAFLVAALALGCGGPPDVAGTASPTPSPPTFAAAAVPTSAATVPASAPTVHTSVTATVRPIERYEYRSVALGVMFHLPGSLGDPGAAACSPVEAGSTVMLSNNVSVAVADAQGLSLDAFITQDLVRFGGVPESRVASLMDSERAWIVNYRIEGSGRSGRAMYAIHGARAYRVLYELRNPGACGLLDPFMLFTETATTLRFTD